MSRNKYMREVKPGVWIDIYDIINCFKITDGGFQHAIKKICAPGQRGHKSEEEDRKDIAASIKRSNEIFFENLGITNMVPQAPPEYVPVAPDYSQIKLSPLQKETIKLMGVLFFLGTDVGEWHFSQSGTTYTKDQFLGAFWQLHEKSLLIEDPLNAGYYAVRPEYLAYVDKTKHLMDNGST